MKYYIGTKMIQAEPKTYGEYVKVKYGKEKDFESNIDENAEGYIVKYSDDYMSWSPKKQFEAAYKMLNINKLSDLKMVENDIFVTQENTIIKHDLEQYNAPHNYIVFNEHTGDIVTAIHFQTGPIKEVGVNGAFLIDVLSICCNMLEHFQRSEFSTRDNAIAITEIENAMLRLKKRLNNRERRNVLGTYNK